MKSLSVRLRPDKLEYFIGQEHFFYDGSLFYNSIKNKKIACASVSVSSPSIIVLDEPSSNLDTNSTDDLRKMISIWKSQGKTITIICLERLIKKLILGLPTA